MKLHERLSVRGKAVDMNSPQIWVAGHYVNLPESVSGVLEKHMIRRDDESGKSRSSFYHIVDPETLGQSTGLKDKNGEPIFEGDIVKLLHNISFHKAGLYQVIHHWGCLLLHNKDDIVMFSDIVFDTQQHPHESIGEIQANGIKVLEVIGNIHSNPELAQLNEK